MIDVMFFIHHVFSALSVFFGSIAAFISLIALSIWFSTSKKVAQLLNYNKQVKFLILAVLWANIRGFLDSAYWGISWPLDALAGAEGTSDLFKYTGVFANVLLCQAPTILIAYYSIRAVEDYLSKNTKIAIWIAGFLGLVIGIYLVYVLETQQV